MTEQFNPRIAEAQSLDVAATAAQGILDALGGFDEPEKAPVQAAEEPDDGQPQDDEAPEVIEAEASDSEETVTTDEPDDVPALEAPNGWSKEAKEAFKTWPREAQAEMVRRSTEQEQLTSRQSQEATERRKIADAELQAATQERQYFATQLNGFVQGLAQMVQQNQTSLDTLASEAERTGDWNPYFMAKHKLEQSQQAHAQAVQQGQLLKTQQMQQEIQMNARALETSIPAWKDGEVAKKELSEVREFIVSQGIPRERVYGVPGQSAGIYQAPLLVMARDAMLYRRQIDAIKAQKPLVTKKVDGKPPVQKPGVASSKAQLEGREKAVLTNRQRTTAKAKHGAANLNATADRFKALGLG